MNMSAFVPTLALAVLLDVDVVLIRRQNNA